MSQVLEQGKAQEEGPRLAEHSYWWAENRPTSAATVTGV